MTGSAEKIQESLVLFCSGLITILFFSLSCNPPVYHERKEIKNYSWFKDNILTFRFNISDSLTSFRVIIDLRHSDHYRYSNLFIKVKCRDEANEIFSDLFDLTLADQEGKWLGDALGDIVDTKVLIMKNFRFSHTGSFTISLQQYMREDWLNHIMEAGIIIKKEKDRENPA